MIGLLSIENNKKKISVKYLFLTFFVWVPMIAWLGISNLQADEDDPGNNRYESEVSFQNAAQAQHAENIATKVALQDRAKTKEGITQDIYDMRSSGMGWGEIAKYYGLHPSILGLGHPKSKHEDAAQISKQQPSKDKSSNRGGGYGGGHGGGNGGGRK
jgi:hypothetical protein